MLLGCNCGDVPTTLSADMILAFFGTTDGDVCGPCLRLDLRQVRN
jgi:hypothetical protein